MTVRDSNTIEIYLPQEPFSLVESVKVGNMGNPCGMAACRVRQCLYVNDAFRKCV